MRKVIFVLILFLVNVCVSLPDQRPIIGILTQQNFMDQLDQKGKIINTYIATSYVDYIQMSGAQVVPIFAYSQQSQISQLLPKLNGVVFPGGAMDFDINQRWTSNANFIFQYAKKQNQLGNAFPILGICLGHQLLGYLTNNFQEPLKRISGQQNKINTINFVSNDRGYLFGKIQNNLVQKLQTSPGVTFFNHNWAILREIYDKSERLKSFWKVIAETTTSANEKIVSVWQARDYPFYGVQSHPQASIFGWKVDSHKSYQSIEISQIISNRFVQKARQSKNFFPNIAEFQMADIQNYNTSKTKLSCNKIYPFKEYNPDAKISSYVKRQSEALLQ